MATTLAPSINFTNVSKGLNSLNTGVGNLIKSSDSVKTVSLNRTKIKRESFARDKVLTSMREEAVRRKDQESIIESSGIGGAMRRSASVIADSTKGFLGRILDFASSLLIGWLLFNLPTIMTAIEDMIVRITSLTQLLQDFISNITNTFTNFGNLLSGVYQNVTQFDFTDESKRVQNAMDDLNINLETMRDQFMQGFDLLSKPLGEGPGEEPVPELNTDYTQDATTTTGGEEGGGIERISKTIAKAETGGRYTAYAGDGGKGNQEITKMTLTQLRQKYGDYNTAVGAYQFMPGTAIGLAKQLKLDPNKTVFTPEVQDRLNQYHLKTMGYEQFKSGKLSQAEFGTRIAQQYRALPDPRTGRTYADKYAKNNAAQISLSEFNTALKESKEKKPTGVSISSLPPLPPTNTVANQYYGAPRPGRKHAGVDFDINGPNAKFYSRIGGVVVGSPFRFGEDGWATDIYNQQLGVYERIAEAAKIVVKPGQTIKPGDLVAVGESRTGVIHYEIRKKVSGGFENSVDPIAFLKNQTPQIAQVSPTTQSGQNVPSIAQNKKGPTILVADNPQQSQPQQVSAGGGGSQPQMIPTESSLNSLIKNQILLELAYT
jgi:hypothetical protein